MKRPGSLLGPPPKWEKEWTCWTKINEETCIYCPSKKVKSHTHYRPGWYMLASQRFLLNSCTEKLVFSSQLRKWDRLLAGGKLNITSEELETWAFSAKSDKMKEADPFIIYSTRTSLTHQCHLGYIVSQTCFHFSSSPLLTHSALLSTNDKTRELHYNFCSCGSSMLPSG